VTETRGHNVAMGMCKTLGADEIVFGVVVEGTMDVTCAMGVTNVRVIACIGPKCETTGGKVDVGSMEPDGANVEV
ncbi:hypothetical protein KI387_038523, partial [Taxus chinensis]